MEIVMADGVAKAFPAANVGVILMENQTLKAQVTRLFQENQQLKRGLDSKVAKLLQENQQLKAELDAVYQNAAGKSDAGTSKGTARKANRLRRRRQESDEESGEEYDGEAEAEDEVSEEEEDYEPPAKQARGGGRKSATPKPSAAEKEAAKAAKQRAKQFLRTAGGHMSEGMAWQRRGCPLHFSVTVDPAAFEIALGDAGEHYDATSSKTSGKKLRMVKLDGDSVVNVFGKTRTIKKYRLGSTGTIDSMDVTYDATLQKATIQAVWSVDADRSRSRW
ncbi:hypothetical protein N2152v2_003568 [Parachlorella kessleri]